MKIDLQVAGCLVVGVFLMWIAYLLTTGFVILGWEVFVP